MYQLKKKGKGIYEYICWDQALVLWKQNLPGRGLTKVGKNCLKPCTSVNSVEHYNWDVTSSSSQISATSHRSSFHSKHAHKSGGETIWICFIGSQQIHSQNVLKRLNEIVLLSLAIWSFAQAASNIFQICSSLLSAFSVSPLPSSSSYVLVSSSY